MPMLPLLLVLAAVDQVPSAPVVADNSERRRLIVLRPGAVTCGGVTEEPVHRELPIPEAQTVYSKQAAHPLTLAFSIDARGRAIDIHEISERQPNWVESDDAAPSLAASQFAAGPVRTRCTVSYSVDALSAAEVPLEDAYRAYAAGRGHSREMFPFYQRTIPAGADCEPFPHYRVRVYPRFDEIERPAGIASWSMIAFDTDARGRTRNVRVLGEGGNAALADETADAMRSSRFVPGAHRGCVTRFWSFPGVSLLPPPAAPTSDYRAPDAQCDGLADEWASMPPLRFPEAFRRRSIEGWAIVRFDVAPWGETGNVEVVAAEPAEAFGDRATQIVRGARKPPSSRGFSGCVEKVSFKIGRPPGPRSSPEEEIIRPIGD
jgi:TonB family protein